MSFFTDFFTRSSFLPLRTSESFRSFFAAGTTFTRPPWAFGFDQFDLPFCGFCEPLAEELEFCATPWDAGAFCAFPFEFDAATASAAFPEAIRKTSASAATFLTNSGKLPYGEFVATFFIFQYRMSGRDKG